VTAGHVLQTERDAIKRLLENMQKAPAGVTAAGRRTSTANSIAGGGRYYQRKPSQPVHTS
jgi:hypothetical protein